mmetsp:Transcript_27801/g.63798  ORF Transcript_27801/g.63798 Transcript_27801/m.63798 type:complete len:327 (-) Transcript_27801:490-1470(-)
MRLLQLQVGPLVHLEQHVDRHAHGLHVFRALREASQAVHDELLAARALHFRNLIDERLGQPLVLHALLQSVRQVHPLHLRLRHLPRGLRGVRHLAEHLVALRGVDGGLLQHRERHQPAEEVVVAPVGALGAGGAQLGDGDRLDDRLGLDGRQRGERRHALGVDSRVEAARVLCGAADERERFVVQREAVGRRVLALPREIGEQRGGVLQTTDLRAVLMRLLVALRRVEVRQRVEELLVRLEQHRPLVEVALELLGAQHRRRLAAHRPHPRRQLAHDRSLHLVAPRLLVVALLRLRQHERPPREDGLGVQVERGRRRQLDRERVQRL